MVKSIRKLRKNIRFLLYRFRYLRNYILIGFLSILLEIAILKALGPLGVGEHYKIGAGFVSGVFFSFYLNAKINFKIPRSKNTRTFTLFLIVSLLAFILNLILMEVLRESINIEYAFLRLITAALVFILSYMAHRKFTFEFIKLIGPAIYLNKGQDLTKIYSQIKDYADFIHIDLIDKTFSRDAKEIDIKLMDEIDKTWGIKKMIHLMSEKPSMWIKKIHSKVDVILIHENIAEDIEKTLELCKKLRKKVGMVIMPRTNLEDIKKFLPRLDYIQVMGIDYLGKSGQHLNLSSLDVLAQVNKLKKSYHFEVIFDGGARPTNVNRINAKYIVSSSGIFNARDPIKSFMDLRSNFRYESFSKNIKRDILLGMKKTVESMEFIESASIVGSFIEEKGIQGINDIDMIVILNEMTKKKFLILLKKFENFKREIESKYAWPVFINNSLGPLKFNDKNIVFHLMVYDRKSHKDHCIKSPFTCYDWQRSSFFFKKPLAEIYKVWGLELSHFFNSRRSSKEYVQNLQKGVIPYRVYECNGQKVEEKQMEKQMTPRDRVEFSYHILKFLITNFLKLYFNKNCRESFEISAKKYFSIFPENKKAHQTLIAELKKAREQRRFDFPSEVLEKKVTSFVEDFEYQFKKLFEFPNG